MKKELYRFTEGVDVWTITSADSDEVYDAGSGDETYVSTTIGRNEVESKNELSRANIEVSLSIDDPMARRWMRQIVDDVVTLTIFSKNGGDVNVVWKGRLSSVKPESAAITLIFESIFTSLRRSGLRKKYQRSCPHILYGRGCKLDKEDFATDGAMTSISTDGQVLTVPEAAAFADGYFTAGMVEAPDGTLRFVTNHSGSSLTLIRPIQSLIEAFATSGYGVNYGAFYGGVAVRIFPGCTRSKEVCNSKFDNLNNYGGFPYIPLKNPFNGSSIV